MKITVNNLNDGINVKNDPSAISDGSVVDAVGFDLTKEGVLEVAQGLAPNDLVLESPAGVKQWMDKVYIGSTAYVLITTDNGLYANGVLIDSLFTGRFKAVSFLNNVFLTNGVYARRFDGTNIYQWGITAPTAVPTLAAGTYIKRDIDSFEDIAEWITNQTSAVVSRPVTGANLVTNGTFTGSAASWTLDAVAWTYNANAVDKDADGTGTLYQTLGHTIGKKYLLTFTITGMTVGSVVASLGGDSGTAITTDGTYYQVLTPTDATALIFTPSNSARFTIDTVSVYESVSMEAGDSSGMKFTVAASAVGYSYINETLDLTEFTTGDESTEKDYVFLWLNVDVLENLNGVTLYFFTDLDNLDTDYFSYTIVGSEGFQTLGVGSTAETLAEETTTTISPTPVPSTYQRDQFGNLIYAGGDQNVEYFSTVITREQLNSQVDRVLADQTLAFWRKSNLFKLQDGVWSAVRIPKSLFLQTGSSALKWTDIKRVKIEVSTESSGGVNVYIDGFKVVGGSDLTGDYWFMYSWGRSDGSDNVVHESSPSRNNTTKQINIVGPVSFDRHPIVYSNRPLSTDPQVDCGVFYALGGGLVDFWALIEVFDNTTVTDTLYGLGESTVTRKLTCKRNEPAPAGTDIVKLFNKIWMVGDGGYPMVLRSSDILDDGTLSPESWPPRNGYELDGNSGELKSVKVLNQSLSVRGSHGEWKVVINDPTDYLQVSARRVSDKGLLGQDAIIELPSSQVYPTNGGFVESNGDQATFILPEIEPLIDSGMVSARGINAGLVSYFSYNSTLTGDRTAKVDLFRGKMRFGNLNNVLFECIFYDKVESKVYGIHNGEIFIIDSGYVNSTTGNEELYAYIKSRVYRTDSCVGWTRVEFHHNTGGVWFRCEIYIDGVLRNNFPFMSTTRTRADFRFGPHPGYDLQFVITGNYKAFAKIYFPIGIYHSGK